MTEPRCVEGAVTRPDGRVYSPRKPPTAHYYDEDDLYQLSLVWLVVWQVIVVRTHDVARAAPLALAALGRYGDVGDVLPDPELTWLRIGYADGGPAWVMDDRRGVPCVVYTMRAAMR